MGWRRRQEDSEDEERHPECILRHWMIFAEQLRRLGTARRLELSIRFFIRMRFMMTPNESVEKAS
jgi:hypothetical protein